VDVVAIVAQSPGKTNPLLVEVWRELGVDARLLTADEAVASLGPGDVALIRLDLLPTLDGFEPGLGRVPALRHLGVRILNPPWAVLGAHDKLETARRLVAAGLPHPRTAHVWRVDAPVDVPLPVVVKPRHGSWGLDVFRCRTEEELRACLQAVEERSWFRRHGALVQELVEPVQHDLRMIVAGAQVVGAVNRDPRPGEWRTNISLGGLLRAAAPDDDACELALAAVDAVGGDLVGVDLLPLADGGYTVLELNGAVDFDYRYSLAGTPPFEAVARALRLPGAVPAPVLSRGRRARTSSTGR
jgi:gamma-F420-2:alpha-L-glutamate ligase